MDRRTFLTTATAVSASLVAGCTDGGGGATSSPTGSPTDSPTDSPTGTATQGAQAKYPNYNWGKLDGKSAHSTTTIEMRNFQFHPLIAAFRPGTELTVTNEDETAHTFTVPRLDIDENIEGGRQVSVTVDRTGTFDYVCTFHPPGMLGRLVVTDSPSTATGTATTTPTPTSGETGTATDTPTPTQTEGDGLY